MVHFALTGPEKPIMHGNNKNNNNWIAVVLVVVAAAVVSLAAAAPLDFTTRPVPDPHCRDLRVNCPERKHECQEHHLWMHSHCPVTCNVCHNRTVETSRQRARFLTATSVDPDTIVDGMGRTVGVPQIISFSSKTNHKKNLTLAAAIVRTVQDSVTYYNKVVMKQERYQSVRALCQNRHERCAEWAVAKDRCNEEAYEDVEYNEYDSATDSHYYYYYSDMIRDCAVTCHRCELLSDEAKCPYTPETMPNAWYPGDVNRMFQRIVTDYSTLYNVTILSKPHDTADPAVATNNDDITDPIRSSIIPEGPWVVTLDNFLTRAECQRLIDLGAAEGYERSSGMVVQANGSLLSDFVTQDRTSRNAWCDSRACRTDPTVRAIHHRMANLTRISSVHYEWMQLLQYKEREFYKVRGKRWCSIHVDS